MIRGALTCVILTALLCACSGLGGEPDIVATFAPAPVADSPHLSETWQPDIARGQRIFAENCVDCHGSSGDGKGQLVLAGSVSAPLDMTDLALTRDKSPLDWFTIISEGNLEKLMPPWQEALSEQDRWHVALYSYTLAYSEELLALGQRLWTDRCEQCQLPAAIPPIASDKDYGTALNRERFADALDAAEIAAVVAYARMRTLEGVDGAGDMVGKSAATLPLGDISGRVIHGSQGGVLPHGMLAQLQYGRPERGFKLAEAAVAADGSFLFADIPQSPEHSYIIGLLYQGRVFSRLLPAGETQQTITIYNLTQDPSVISVAAIDLFVHPLRLEPQTRGLGITQIIRYRNDSDRIFTSGRGFDDGREASLLLQFPAGAQILSGEAGGRYVLVQDLENVPDSLIDTLPVAPGVEHEIAVEYFLPYDESLDFNQAFNNRIQGEITVTLPKSLSLESATFQARQEKMDGEASDQVKVYTGWLDQERDARLRFQLAGNAFATSDDDASLLTGDSLMAALLGLCATTVATVAAMTGFAWRRKRRAPDPAKMIDKLTRQIAQLDDEHDRGKINHDFYHQRRRELKAKLAELMSQQRASA